MKVILLLLGFVSVNFGYPIPRTWTFFELYEAVVKDHPWEPNPERATLVYAFSVIGSNIFENQEYLIAKLLSPTGEKVWTKTQMEEAVKDSNTNPYYLKFISRAYTELGLYNENPANKGKEKDTMEVLVWALDISNWSKEDITKALEDPSTKPDMLPYLRAAQKKLDQLDVDGKKKDKEPIVTPVGLIPLP